MARLQNRLHKDFSRKAKLGGGNKTNKQTSNSLIRQYFATVFPKGIFKSVSIVRKTTGKHLHCNKNWTLQQALLFSSVSITSSIAVPRFSTLELLGLQLCVLIIGEAQDWHDRSSPYTLIRDVWPVPPDPCTISSSVLQLRDQHRKSALALLQLKSKKLVIFFLFPQSELECPEKSCF